MGTANPRREFRVLDAMLLMAATAVACGIVRVLIRGNAEGLYFLCIEMPLEEFNENGWRSAARTLFDRVYIGPILYSLSLLTLPVISMWMFAVVPMRLLAPRPRLRRLVAQPAFMAACASTLAMAVVALQFVVAAIIVGFEKEFSKDLVVTDVSITGGLAIMSTWVTMLLGRRWRAEPSWLDRIGRILGVLWCLACLGTWLGWGLVVTSPWGGLMARKFNELTTAAILGKKILSFVSLITPTVAVGTLAVTCIGLMVMWRRPPRRKWHPGMMAGFVSITAILCLGLPMAAIVMSAENGSENFPDWLQENRFMPLVAKLGGLAILVSWLALIVNRLWMPEPSWIDRLGRALGVIWIMAALAFSVSAILVKVR